MSAGLKVRTIGGVLELTFDVPDRRNSLTRRLLADLRAELDALAAPDCGVHGAVLTGHGCFSAGADLTELNGTAADATFDDAVAEVTRVLRAATVPVFAAIEGPCVGAAADIALSCDVRIAGRSAWLYVPAVPLGILYNPDAIAVLCAGFPRPALVRLFALAERIGAPDALTAGLVDRVVADGASADTARSALDRLAGAPPGALTATKQLLNALSGDEHDLATWRRIRNDLLESTDRASAVAHARAAHRIDPATKERT